MGGNHLAGQGQHQRHGVIRHAGGGDPRRIGYRDATDAARAEIDAVVARAEIDHDPQVRQNSINSRSIKPPPKQAAPVTAFRTAGASVPTAWPGERTVVGKRFSRPRSIQSRVRPTARILGKGRAFPSLTKSPQTRRIGNQGCRHEPWIVLIVLCRGEGKISRGRRIMRGHDPQPPGAGARTSRGSAAHGYRHHRRSCRGQAPRHQFRARMGWKAFAAPPARPG